MEDLYTWRVTSHDGTIIDEYDSEHPQGRGWASVDAARVITLELLARDGFPAHCVQIPASGKPVFFRRRSVEISPLDGSEKRKTLHCIGYPGAYLFVRDTGATVLTRDMQEVMP